MARALEGVKVVDFGWIATEPLIARFLAEYGAQVVRVESATRLDGCRTTGPYKDNVPGPDRAPFFANLNHSKYGVSLNLRNPKGAEVAKRLVAWADIVGEAFTPGTMKGLGLDYEELRKVNPDIIMVSTCQQGQTGPYAKHPGMGYQLPSVVGFTHLLGWPGTDVASPYGAYTDFPPPLFGAVTLIAALDYRRRTGRGQHLDLGQYEASIHFLTPLVLDYTVNGRVANRMGNRCPYAAPHGAYPCQGEDRWCAVAVFSDEEWRSFCQVIGDPPWVKDPRFATVRGRKQNEDELDTLIGEWTCRLPAPEVMTMMQAAGVPAGVVQTEEEVCQDPQLWHRQHFWRIKHPVIGEHSYEQEAFRLSKAPAEPNMPGPCLGEHNEYVCTEFLGMSDDEFLQLLGEGAFE
jgi:benzylsuccinate CoA-transferase BbsF subunit